MDTDPTVRDRPVLHVALLGHAGHGKTTLLTALTHRLAARPGGVSVPLPAPGEAPTVWGRCVAVASPRRRYVLHDLPGRRGFIREASRGLGIRDVAVVVISAEQAARAQTRELVLHARGLTARQTLVFLNACDRPSDPAWLDAVEADARQSLIDVGVDGDDVLVLRGSALGALRGDPRWTPGVDGLLDALDALDDVLRAVDGPLVIPVSESYPRPRKDDVVVGRVRSGRVKVGQVVELPGVGSYLVRSLQQHGRSVETCEAGELAGLGLTARAGTARIPLRGEVLGAGEAVRLREEFFATVRLIALSDGGRHTPLRTGMRAFFHLGTAGRMGVVRLPPGFESLSPGAVCTMVRVRLDRPIWAAAGMRFAFRDGSVGPRRDRESPLEWAGTAGVGEVL